MELEVTASAASGEGSIHGSLLSASSETSTNDMSPQQTTSTSSRTGSQQWNTRMRTSAHHKLKHEPGRFQSLDYDACTSDLSTKRLAMYSKRNWYGYSGASVGRWVITVAIGIGIGLVAFFMTRGIEFLIEYKMRCIFPESASGEGEEGAQATMNASQIHGESVDDVVECTAHPLVTFVFWNVLFATLACVPTVFIAPESAGSGIPEVMGYLNGVHIRNFLRMKTLASKVWGTVLIVSSGLAVGPEGPLVHTGAILGSGLTRGHKTCGKKRIHSPALFAMFHNDTDRRDFISMGAAAGFAAAFGAPIGGVLFALEEASSFWSAKLMWRLLLCTSTACFTLSITRSVLDTSVDAGEMNNRFEPGMLTLNTKDNVNFVHEWELVLCGILGCLGGLLGALFNKLNEVVMGWRPKAKPTTQQDLQPVLRCLRMSRQHFYRIMEVLTITLITSLVFFGLPYYGAKSRMWTAYNTSLSQETDPTKNPSLNNGWACRCDDTASHNKCNYQYVDALGTPLDPGSKDPALSYHYVTYQFYCESDDLGNIYYNDMATIFLTGRENAILSLIEAPHRFSFTSLGLIGTTFFLLMLLAFGAAYPAGIFMPTIVIGTAFGALFGQLVKYSLCLARPDMDDLTVSGTTVKCDWSDSGGSTVSTLNWIPHAGPYALLGAVALLGGVQRSSLSLVVIMVEGTGKIDYLLPIILTTVCAKWVGDKLNDGFYHTALHIKGIPFLDNEGVRGLQNLSAKDMMSPNPIIMRDVSTVADVIDIMEGCQHDGFPVVREMNAGKGNAVDVYCGTILRSSLAVLIDQRRFYKEVPLEDAGTRDSAGKMALGGTDGDTELVRVEEDRDAFDVEVGKNAARSKGSIYGSAGTAGDSDAGRSSSTLERNFSNASLDFDTQPHTSMSPATRKTVLMVHEANHRSNQLEYSARVIGMVRDTDHGLLLNVGEAMNRAPYHVLTTTPGQKVHRLFRTMGLRHLVVCDELNQVQGMITRGDLIVCMHEHQGEDGTSLHT